MAYFELTGHKFGLVTVISRAESASNVIFWRGVCECGSIRVFRSTRLKNQPPTTHKFCHRGYFEERNDVSGTVVVSRGHAERDLAKARERRWKDAERQIFEALRDEGYSETEARAEARQAVATRRRKQEGPPIAVHGQDGGANAEGLAKGAECQIEGAGRWSRRVPA
jgi:hypothetical protein